MVNQHSANLTEVRSFFIYGTKKIKHMEGFERFKQDGQQREALEWVMGKIAPLIAPNEIVEYIATGFIVDRVTPDAIIITSSRYFTIKSELLRGIAIKSSETITPFDKLVIERCHITVPNKIIAEVSLVLKSGISSTKLYIPVKQAYQVYKWINNKEFSGIPIPREVREHKQIPPKYKKFIYAGALIISIIVVGMNQCNKSEEKPDKLSEKAQATSGNSGKLTYDANGNQIVQQTQTGGMELQQLSRIDIGQIRYYYFVKNFNQNDPACWVALDRKGESLASMEPVGSCVIIEFLNTETLTMDKSQPGVLSEKSIPNVILQYARYTNGKANSQADPYGTGNFVRKK